MPLDRQIIWQLLSVLALAALPFAAQADDPDADAPDSIDRQAAKRHFNRGAELYRAEQYRAAIDAFERALEADPNAMIHYNLSLAYLNDDQPSDALRHARKAQEFGDMPPKVAARNRARIDALQTAAQARKWGARFAESDAPSPDPSSNPLYGSEPDSGSSEPPPPLFGPPGWAGIGLAVGGAGSLGAAAAIDAGLRGDVADYRQAAQRGDADTYRRLEDSISTRQTAGRVLLYSGVGLATAGAGLLIYELVGPSDSRRTSTDSPITVTPSARGVRVDVSF